MSEQVKQENRRDLGMMTPRRAIGYALTFAFLLFLAMDLLEAVITNDTAMSNTRLWHFARGFIATSCAMFFVWLPMHRKEKELIALRDRQQQQLQQTEGEVKSLTEQRAVESEAKDVLQSTLDTERRDFLNVINHRLRTPILASGRIAGLLLQGAFGPLNEEQTKILGHLSENEAEVSRLLDNLIGIYSYKNKVKTLEAVSTNFNALVENALKDADSKLDGNGISWQLDLRSPSVVCDPEEISKVVRHLLDNAARHARSHVKVQAGANGPGTVFISIEDDGMGIPAKDVETLLDRFYLLSADGKYAPTTGVGLCLCNEIAKAHGGKISCESTVGKGTRFTLTLPSMPQTPSTTGS